jgi:hypothetical protein
MKGSDMAGVIFLVLLIFFIGNTKAASEVYEVTLGTTDCKSGMYPWLCPHATEVNRR